MMTRDTTLSTGGDLATLRTAGACRPGHVASYRDAIVTCAGAAVGAYLGGVIVAPADRGVWVGIARSF